MWNVCYFKLSDQMKMLQISTLFLLVLSIETSLLLKSKVCSTEACLIESQKMLNRMDVTVDPCRDFYEFACGKFRRETVIPDDQESVTSFTIVKDKVRDQMHSVLSENSNSTGAQEPNAIKLIKVFAQSCFDDITLNKNGEN